VGHRDERRLSTLISLFSLGANAGGSRATLELTSRLDSSVTYLVADPSDANHMWSPDTARHGIPSVAVNRLRPKPHVRPGTASARRLLYRNLDLPADLVWLRRQDRIATASGADLVCSMTTLMQRADVFFVHFLRAQAVEQTYGVSVSRADALLRRIDLKERHLLHLERANLRPENHRLLVAPSYRTAADLSAYYDVPPERIRVVHNGVDDRVFRPPTGSDRVRARALLGLDRDDVLVVFVGRSPERKGLVPLVESVARTAGRRPDRRVRLALTGFADVEYGHRMLAENGIDGYVPGELSPDELRRNWYAAADVLALPSRVEPFGLVALEAMACGVPAAVTDVAGSSEVISSGRTGTVLASADLDASLDRLLVDAIESRIDLAAMGRAARRDVERRFSWESRAANLQDVLDELAHRGPSLVSRRRRANGSRPTPVVPRPRPVLAGVRSSSRGYAARTAR